MQRWQQALHSDAHCCTRLEDALRGGEPTLLLVHWSGLDAHWQRTLLARPWPGALVALVDRPSPEEGEWLLRHGVSGYANTYIQPELLPELVASVMRGDVWAGPEVMQGLLKRLLDRQEPVLRPADDWHLSGREQEVLALLAQGLSNKLIARQLEITERTVKAHVSAILEKSGVHDRIELILKLSGQTLSDSRNAGAKI
ncbi:response regulator transcription factor [Marinobacterium sp. A346]|uniref:Response regulator transcription factor n=2 Tax=Marinobacterium weihaiense TaxID=2851016 RepID=A0ABS6MA53_9GAMM|nr:response regulator transcription factor [Marinobacterium weihaiense]